VHEALAAVVLAYPKDLDPLGENLINDAEVVKNLERAGMQGARPAMGIDARERVDDAHGSPVAC
jgi:hypothetical protein